MSNGLATLAGGLVGLAALGAVGAAAAARARRGKPYLARGLYIAIDGPVDPAVAAARAGYAGVEVGVRLSAGELRLTCAMPPGQEPPTFEQAVLTPLANRVAGNALGRVHPRRAEPFLLLVRSEDGSPHEAFARLLSPHTAILTTFLGGRVVPGAITGPHRARAGPHGVLAGAAGGRGRPYRQPAPRRAGPLPAAAGAAGVQAPGGAGPIPAGAGHQSKVNLR